MSDDQNIERINLANVIKLNRLIAEKDAEIATLRERLVKALGLNDSRHARHNLDGALLDLTTSRRIDYVCLNTIRRVIGQLREVENALTITPTPKESTGE